MRSPAKILSIGIPGILLATLAGVAWLATDGVRAQTPPAPCACSRATSIVGVEEASPAATQFQARFSVVHCQCGTATCVSQLPLGAGGVHQLACVK